MLLVVGGENLGMKFFASVFDLNLKISKKFSSFAFSIRSIDKKKSITMSLHRGTNTLINYVLDLIANMALGNGNNGKNTL